MMVQLKRIAMRVEVSQTVKYRQIFIHAGVMII